MRKFFGYVVPSATSILRITQNSNLNPTTDYPPRVAHTLSQRTNTSDRWGLRYCQLMSLIFTTFIGAFVSNVPPWFLPLIGVFVKHQLCFLAILRLDSNFATQTMGLKYVLHLPDCCFYLCSDQNSENFPFHFPRQGVPSMWSFEGKVHITWQKSCQKLKEK